MLARNQAEPLNKLEQPAQERRYRNNSFPIITDGLYLHDVQVNIGDKEILNKVSIGIKKGTFLVVLGDSGSGKTTLLRTIAGFVRLTSGEIWVGEKEIGKLPPHKRKIGFVHQQYALFPHMTVFDNVAFGLKSLKIKDSEIREKVFNYLKMVKLENYAFYMPSELSGGMQQRVSLIRALAIEPELLLLDEPLSAIDTNLRIELREEFQALRERFPELTFVYVTHDREEALLLSDRIALLKDGKLAQEGTPNDLYDNPNNEFVARYLGKVNLLPENFAKQSLKNILFLSKDLYDSPYNFFLRPEKIKHDLSCAVTASGKVLKRKWLGPIYQVIVRLNRHEEVLMTLYYQRDGQVPALGTDIQLSFDPKDIMVVKN